ncbi:MAG TPA: CBS domain-containing protein [Kofleriaceae bacterium]|nr:CBS domain-containing protein [Kofleriaceae bacterium]
MQHPESISIADLMTRDPVTMSARTSASRALAHLEEVGVRHLPVIDHDRNLVGVISQRDLVAAVRAGDGRTLLADLMQPDVVAVTPDTPAHEVAYLMLHHGYGCIPVIDRDGHLVGIATDADFVRVAYAALGGKVPVDERESEEKEAASV